MLFLSRLDFIYSSLSKFHLKIWWIVRSGALRQAECTKVLEHCQRAIRKLNQSCVRFTPHLCDLWNKSYITNRTSFHSFSWCMKLTSASRKFTVKLGLISVLLCTRLSNNYLNTLPYLLLVIISMHCRLFLYIVLR